MAKSNTKIKSSEGVQAQPLNNQAAQKPAGSILGLSSVFSSQQVQDESISLEENQAIDILLKQYGLHSSYPIILSTLDFLPAYNKDGTRNYIHDFLELRKNAIDTFRGTAQDKLREILLDDSTISLNAANRSNYEMLDDVNDILMTLRLINFHKNGIYGLLDIKNVPFTNMLDQTAAAAISEFRTLREIVQNDLKLPYEYFENASTTQIVVQIIADLSSHLTSIISPSMLAERTFLNNASIATATNRGLISKLSSGTTLNGTHSLDLNALPLHNAFDTDIVSPLLGTTLNGTHSAPLNALHNAGETLSSMFNIEYNKQSDIIDSGEIAFNSSTGNANEFDELIGLPNHGFENSKEYIALFVQYLTSVKFSKNNSAAQSSQFEPVSINSIFEASSNAIISSLIFDNKSLIELSSISNNSGGIIESFAGSFFGTAFVDSSSSSFLRLDDFNKKIEEFNNSLDSAEAIIVRAGNETETTQTVIDKFFDMLGNVNRIRGDAFISSAIKCFDYTGVSQELFLLFLKFSYNKLSNSSITYEDGKKIKKSDIAKAIKSRAGDPGSLDHVMDLSEADEITEHINHSYIFGMMYDIVNIIAKTNNANLTVYASVFGVIIHILYNNFTPDFYRQKPTTRPNRISVEFNDTQAIAFQAGLSRDPASYNYEDIEHSTLIQNANGINELSEIYESCSGSSIGLNDTVFRLLNVLKTVGTISKQYNNSLNEHMLDNAREYFENNPNILKTTTELQIANSVKAYFDFHNNDNKFVYISGQDSFRDKSLVGLSLLLELPDNKFNITNDRNKKIISLGLTAGLYNYLLRNSANKNPSRVKFSIHKRDILRDNITFKPKEIIFSLPHHIVNSNYEIEDTAIFVDEVPESTVNIKPVLTAPLYGAASLASQSLAPVAPLMMMAINRNIGAGTFTPIVSDSLLPSSKYLNFINNKIKILNLNNTALELDNNITLQSRAEIDNYDISAVDNNISSYFLGEYIRLLYGINISENQFMLGNIRPDFIDDTQLQQSLHNAFNSTAEISAHQSDILKELKYNSIQFNTESIKRKILFPTLFDRVFHTIIDIEDFEIDTENSELENNIPVIMRANAKKNMFKDSIGKESLAKYYDFFVTAELLT